MKAALEQKFIRDLAIQTPPGQRTPTSQSVDIGKPAESMKEDTKQQELQSEAAPQTP